MLAVLFALQGLARLAMLLTTMREGALHVVAVHALDLGTFAALAGLGFVVLRTRRIALALLALVLSAGWLVLWAYDGLALVALWHHQRPMALSTVGVFYCNAESIGPCASAFPGAALVVGLVWLGLAWLLYRASAGLADLCLSLTRWMKIPGRIAALLVLGGAALWIGAWALRFGTISGFEPLHRFLAKGEFGAQPRELLTIPRPDYRVQPTPGTAPRMLVLITIDALRADAVELKEGGATPFLSSLVATSKLHDLGPAVAVCPESYCGIVGLLSSSDWATLEKGPPLTLPDVLAANGYQSHFLLSGPHRRAMNLAKLYGPNVTTLLDDSSPDSSGLIDDREQVRRLRELKLADPARSFVFVHLMSAHGAGLRFAASKAGKGDYAAYYRQGVAQADGIVRELFAVLEARGLLRDALVVIAADHGERLRDPVGHGGKIDIDTALVPLLVYDPRGGPWPRGGQAMPSLVDLAPTLLAGAGIATPPEWQGRALQSVSERAVAPSDSDMLSALIGRIAGKPIILRCAVKSGAVTAFGDLGAPGMTPAALFAQWSAGLARRKDAARCPGRAR